MRTRASWVFAAVNGTRLAPASRFARPVGAAIEFRFVLPLGGEATGNGEIRGRARVVRLVEPSVSSQWFCGIAIEQYELTPAESDSLN